MEIKDSYYKILISVIVFIIVLSLSYVVSVFGAYMHGVTHYSVEFTPFYKKVIISIGMLIIIGPLSIPISFLFKGICTIFHLGIFENKFENNTDKADKLYQEAKKSYDNEDYIHSLFLLGQAKALIENKAIYVLLGYVFEKLKRNDLSTEMFGKSRSPDFNKIIS